MAPNMYPNGPVAPARQGGIMKGRDGYPDASQMPEIDDSPVDPSQAPADMQGINPVVEALKTLQQFTAALESKQDPRAQGMKDHLLGIIETVSGGAVGAGGQPGAATGPEQGQPQPPAPTAQPKPEMTPPNGEREGMPEDDMEDAQEGEQEDNEEDIPQPQGPLAKKGGKAAMMRRLGRDMNQTKGSVPLI